MFERIAEIRETSKSIEALQLEAENNNRVARGVLRIYAFFCALIVIGTFWEPITNWVSSKLGKSSDEDDLLD